MPAAFLVNSGQKSNNQRTNPAAKPAPRLVNSGLCCEKHKENTSNIHSFSLFKNFNRLASFNQNVIFFTFTPLMSLTQSSYSYTTDDIV